jgi:branched-chain amino acid transport system substrate-binding protein
MRFLKLSFKACLIISFLSLCRPEAKAFQYPKKEGETVKIGLLIPDNNSPAAKYGAEMAVRDANEKGGFNGIPFQLVVRSMEGPWGTGSKEAVNLIFDEQVWAIMGSHDGRNAHLVEQVTTKARIVFLSAWAGDPTLSQAFVPWYFSCVPNDLQQADAMIKEVYDRRKFTKIALVSDNDYDSKMALKSYQKVATIAGQSDQLLLLPDNSIQSCSYQADKIAKADINCVVILGKDSSLLEIIEQIRYRKINMPVFGSLAFLDENHQSVYKLTDYENIMFVSSDDWLRNGGSSFTRRFRDKYGRLPGAVTAYAYDGMSILIEAIRKAGLDRDKIQTAVSETNLKGVTGIIKFDKRGNREGDATVLKIKKGLPVTVER